MKEKTAGNSTSYKKLAVQWLNEALSFGSSSVMAKEAINNLNGPVSGWFLPAVQRPYVWGTTVWTSTAARFYYYIRQHFN